MVTFQKYDYKMKGYYKAWEPAMSITAYFTGLNKFQIPLNSCRILTSTKEKTMAAGACICGKVRCSQMARWSYRRTSPQLTRHGQPPNLLKRKLLERCQYSAAMAKQSQFKEAVLAEQEQVAAEEKKETQEMMFTLLQGQAIERYPFRQQQQMKQPWQKNTPIPLPRPSRRMTAKLKRSCARRSSAPTAKCLFSTSPTSASTIWRPTRTRGGLDGNQSRKRHWPDRDWGHQ